MRRWQRRVIGILSVCALLGASGGFLWSRASERAACASDKSVATVRSLYFAREFDRAAETAARTVNRCSEAVQLSAWHVLSAARTTQRRTAHVLAQQLVAKYADDPWAYFALAATAPRDAAGRSDAALEASVQAWSREQGNADFLWMYAESLRTRGHTDEAFALLEENRPLVERSAQLLVLEGSMLLDAETKQGSFDIEESKALATFARARLLDTANVDAHYLPGRFLFAAGRLSRAHALLKTAAGHSYASEVMRTYWACLVKRDDLAPLDKYHEIEASIDQWANARTHDPYLLLTASVLYGQLGLDAEQAALQERLIREDRRGDVAEAVFASRFLAPGIAGDVQQQNDALKLAKHRAALRSFLKRPKHHDPALLRHARRMLFESIRDDLSVAADEVLELAKAMARDPAIAPVFPYSHGAIALADRKSLLPEAERLARRGLAIATSATPGSPHASKPLEASMRHALGWVYFKEGRIEQAIRELQLAHELSKHDARILAHLSAVYESRGEHDLAESALVKCVAISLRGSHPCGDSLREYYQRRNHGLKGFDAYMRDIAGRVRAERVATLAASRSTVPRPLPPFRLNVLGGDTLSSAELQGKVVVMIFFALWCHVCTSEMPEYAELANRYRNVRDVVVLGISNDPNPIGVRDWLVRNGYAFDVLIDDGYSSEAGVQAVPTAWFINGQGDRVFVIEGPTGDLADEYSARIEMLRSPARDAAKFPID